jgi:hypothetical protein
MSRRRRPERPPVRRGPGLVPQARVLIVCEGRKTEPGYLIALCRRKGLTAVEAISSGGGSDPMSVVGCAIARGAAAADAGRPYDRVWCVFDRDEHVRVPEAMEVAADNGIGVVFSSPCVELWYLLHFRYSTRYLGPGDAESELRENYLSGYAKSLDNREWRRIYAQALEPRETEACQHAHSLRRRHEQNSPRLPQIAWNPYSSMDRLVCYLRELADARLLP